MSFWIILSLVLLSLEVLSLSFFLLFFGLAALIVAILTSFISLSLATQVLLFSLFSALFFVIGKRVFKNKKNEEIIIDDELVGKIVIALEDAKDHSYLKVLIGDTIWQAYTKEAVKKNQQVKIINRKNLTVEIQPL